MANANHMTGFIYSSSRSHQRSVSAASCLKEAFRAKRYTTQECVTEGKADITDVGANDREDDSLLKAKTTFGAFVAGPRVTLRRRRFTPFGHVLGGAVRFDAALTGLSLEPKDSVTHRVIQLGGGLDATVNRRFAVRIAADYRRVFAEDGGATILSGNMPFVRRVFPSPFCCELNQFRLTTGIVMRVGSR